MTNTGATLVSPVFFYAPNSSTEFNLQPLLPELNEHSTNGVLTSRHSFAHHFTRQLSLFNQESTRMDSVPDFIQLAKTRWQLTSFVHRVIAGVATFVLLAGILLISHQTSHVNYVPLSLGKQFSLEELSNIEISLREQQLTSFKREGQQILVPEEEQTAYDAALLKENQLPQDWASEWEAKYEQTNPFTSSRKLQMLKEISLAKELKRIIQGLDGIAEANVVWAETSTWPARGQKVTASVNIRPQPGHTLSDQTIRAIQFSVANMVPNLEPQDVVVLDYAAGRHYQMHPEQARFETDLDQWIDREVLRWQSTLLPALLHHWPESTLSVNPQLESFRQTAWQMTTSQTLGVPQLRSIEQELRHRFPEYLSLNIDLPEGTTPTGEMPLESEIHAALIGWLPASFQERQLSINVSKAEDFPLTSEVATPKFSAKSWQPVIMVSLAGAFLFVVSRKLRGDNHSSVISLEAEPIELERSEIDEDRTIESVEPPPLQSLTVNPLGDPEMVADVLKQWLGQTQATTSASEQDVK
jgi:type III secretory pathway lipoprotein EscJ